MWVWTRLMVRCTRYKVIKLVSDLQQVSGTLVSSTNKTDRHNITEILLKVALNTKHSLKPVMSWLDLTSCPSELLDQPMKMLLTKSWQWVCLQVSSKGKVKESTKFQLEEDVDQFVSDVNVLVYFNKIFQISS